ncbi:MAG: ChaN family lipoprotein, partial [Rhodospirillaceae bacterium]
SEGGRSPGEGALRSFAAQVTRDDTMAESMAAHMNSHPGRKIVHLNGSFHSDSFLGTVERVRMRAPSAKIAVVSPLTTDSATPDSVSEDDRKLGTFILRIRALPEAYASEEERREAIKRQMEAREERACAL